MLPDRPVSRCEILFYFKQKSSAIYDHQDDGHYDWDEDRHNKEMGR